MMMKNLNLNRLKEARFFTKKPQIQLWLETGIHYSTISRIECGYITPSVEQKKKLARALNADVDWLFSKISSGSKGPENNRQTLDYSKEATSLPDKGVKGRNR